MEQTTVEHSTNHPEYDKTGGVRWRGWGYLREFPNSSPLSPCLTFLALLFSSVDMGVGLVDFSFMIFFCVCCSSFHPRLPILLLFLTFFQPHRWDLALTIGLFFVRLCASLPPRGRGGWTFKPPTHGSASGKIERGVRLGSDGGLPSFVSDPDNGCRFDNRSCRLSSGPRPAFLLVSDYGHCPHCPWKYPSTS